MNVTFACPRCTETSRAEVNPGSPGLTCRHCGLALEAPDDAYDEGQLVRCLSCPSSDLFVRKDFPQRLGVAIVVAGFAASCVTWYLYQKEMTFAVLVATALVDVVLYRLVGDSLVCYRCGAQYRQLPGLEGRAGFDLATHERHRQQAARLAQRKSTAGDAAGH
ncbi:MAG TPA: hypothetical protein VMV69_02615 [Pirellulales bacterium]|nr:hypothetical protein [Pirellulales bacterium]